MFVLPENPRGCYYSDTTDEPYNTNLQSSTRHAVAAAVDTRGRTRHKRSAVTAQRRRFSGQRSSRVTGFVAKCRLYISSERVLRIRARHGVDVALTVDTPGNMSSDEEENNNEEEQEAWVRIQENTFTNWVNDKLRKHNVEVTHLKRDFRDGVYLCKLVENLVGRPIGRVITKKNLNFYEASGNIALALNAIKEAGVRLVNIGRYILRSFIHSLSVGVVRWDNLPVVVSGSSRVAAPRAGLSPTRST